ncbi:MAG: hypothetical protein ACI9Z3_001995 [Roseivirga sp.]|jgi:hypothetical protein
MSENNLMMSLEQQLSMPKCVEIQVSKPTS